MEMHRTALISNLLLVEITLVTNALHVKPIGTSRMKNATIEVHILLHEPIHHPTRLPSTATQWDTKSALLLSPRNIATWRTPVPFEDSRHYKRWVTVAIVLPTYATVYPSICAAQVTTREQTTFKCHMCIAGTRGKYINAVERRNRDTLPLSRTATDLCLLQNMYPHAFKELPRLPTTSTEAISSRLSTPVFFTKYIREAKHWPLGLKMKLSPSTFPTIKGVQNASCV